MPDHDSYSWAWLQEHIAGMSPAERERFDRRYPNAVRPAPAIDANAKISDSEHRCGMASGSNDGVGVVKNTVTSESQISRGLERGNKYHAVAEYVDGVRYASKKEAQYARELVLRVRAGELLSFVPHVRFPLPGGAVHEVDFMLLYVCPNERRECHAEFVEVKGRDLPMGKLKRRQVEAIYKIRIEVI